ncbi:MAG: DUF58 domain-containing protein [Acidimicrobiales bacterium]
MRRGDAGSVGLTQRGWTLLAVAASMIAAAALFGLQELYPPAAAALVLVAACRLWVGARTWDVRAARHVHPPRVPAGVVARVDVTARNHSRGTSPVVTLRDPFDGGAHLPCLMVAPLGAGEAATATYSLPTCQRGVFQIGPMELEMTDPFGLARAVKVAAPPATLTVHPPVTPIRSRQLPADAKRDTRVPLPVLGSGGDEFYGLREYRVGDDLRRVHWVSTARTDELMIRQPENLWKSRLTVTVDLRAHAHGASTLDAVLSAAASIADAGLRSGLDVRLMTTAGLATPYASGHAHRAAILDSLAAARTHPGVGLPDTVRSAGRSGPMVLVTTDAVSDADLSPFTRPGRPTVTTVVLFERGPGEPAHGRPEVGKAAPSGPDRSSVDANRLVRVTPGSSFQSAWDRLQ